MDNQTYTEQSRWKSPVVWSAIVAQLVVILQLTGIFDTLLSEQVQTIASAILQLGVIVGVLNDPTNNTGF